MLEHGVVRDIFNAFVHLLAIRRCAYLLYFDRNHIKLRYRMPKAEQQLKSSIPGVKRLAEASRSCSVQVSDTPPPSILTVPGRGSLASSMLRQIADNSVCV